MLSRLLLVCLVTPVISYPPQAPALVPEEVTFVTLSQDQMKAWLVPQRQTLSFNGSADEIIAAYPEICWNDRCVPTEALLTFIDQEGR